MGDENPLVTWSFYDDAAFPSSRDVLAQVDTWLDGVARELERPKPKYPHAALARFIARLPRASRERAEALFPRVWHAGGTNAHDAEMGLLSLVGFTADPASIPFWKDAIALSKVRDRIASRRRATAAAALAFTALRHPGSDAFATLEALTRDEHPGACAAAVDTLAHLAADEENRLARPALEILRRVARDQGAFATRFIARRFLLRSGEPLPPCEAADAIAFEVTFGKCRRTIELAAEQTLEDLHLAILDAFGWDTDHLHQFSLSGDLRDERFTIPAPGEGPPPFSFAEPPGEGEEPLPPPEEAVFPVGAMGLPVGHEIAYLYDFGDCNLFRIKVADVHPKAPRAKYPRVTARVGKAPPQYPSF